MHALHKSEKIEHDGERTHYGIKKVARSFELMKKIPPRRILFITWDGPHTSYLEGLFLPIFIRLKAFGLEPHVLQFSWGEERVHNERATLCEAAGVPYRYVPIWRSGGGAGPFLTAWLGARHIRRTVLDWKIDTLLPRSLMPALAVLRLSQSERSTLSLVFDADGLAADEKVDFERLSPHSLVYRVLRDIEAEMLRVADTVLCRTEAAKGILQARAGAGVKQTKYHVVSNGKNPEPYARALQERKPRHTDRFRLCYCGSIGEKYRLPEMIELSLFLKRSIPNLTFDLYTPAIAEVRNEIERRGLVGEEWISWRSLPAEDVPIELVECDLGVAMLQSPFSMRAVQAIKVSEYLMAGVPVVGTPSIGDSRLLIEEGVFRSAEKEDREQTLRWILDQVIPKRDRMREVCHEIGRKYFSVKQTADRYVEALKFSMDS